MRLWSLHPAYLDAQGLVALWREGLLARKVLQRRTRGYRAHPQLERFKALPDPVAAINAYLQAVLQEAGQRGYHFDRRKLKGTAFRGKLGVTHGQLRYEMGRLRQKLALRAAKNSSASRQLPARKTPCPHPIFKILRGGIAPWEKPAKLSTKARSPRTAARPKIPSR